MKKVVEARGTVIVIKQRQERVTKGGIHIPTIAVEGGSMEEFEGTILAVGEKVKLFKPGEVVSFGKHAGSIKFWNKEEYWLLFEHSINTVEKLVEDDAKLSTAQFVVEEKVQGEKLVEDDTKLLTSQSVVEEKVQGE